MENDSYRETIEKWRIESERKLIGENGWLAVAGLYWLAEGVNRAGSGSSNAIVLPEPAPDFAGTFCLADGRVTFEPADGVRITLNGEPVTAQAIPMRSDVEGKPDKIGLGSLTMTVIQRGARIGVRLYDQESARRKEFQGRAWFPVDPAYRVTARFVSYDPPKQVEILNILGDTEPAQIPGYALFMLFGNEYRLDAESSQPERSLFFNFRDATSGKSTYPAGRFLYTGGVKNGQVVLDFNKAVSPPCAFTDYATCPLPPPGNSIQLPVEAGEKYTGAEHH